MKKLSLLLCIIFIVSCGEKKQKTTDESTNEAVCIWDGASLRQGPSSNTKWLSSVSLGEKVTLLGETQTDSVDNIEFVKVQLSDGKEGWVSSNLIIPEGKVAAIVEKSVIYKRPDLLTSTEKSFDAMEMVVITSESDDPTGVGWLEVTGNQKKKSGWIKKSAITDSSLDVSVAILATKALEITDHEKRMEEINKIINNADLRGSIFIETLKKKIDPFSVKKVIQVNTVKEFADALGSNRKIEITAAEINISKMDEFITDMFGYDGYEFSIFDVKNLIIAGANDEPTKFLSNEGFSNVISFENSNKIALKNLSIGHTTAPDECGAAVLSFNTCDDIFIMNCDLFGSGTYGFVLGEVTNFEFINSTIRDCSNGILHASTCTNLKFEESVFRNNDGYEQITLYGTDNVTFSNCEIYENKTYYDPGYGYGEAALFFLDEYSSVYITGCMILNNSLPFYTRGSGKIDGMENEIGGNVWENEYYEYEEEYYEGEGGDYVQPEGDQYY
ncbi:MAG: SH3 domain-containing protein [Bacteroidales bacterium]|nr:SH3 domain-containing protein [Bacteroidales bacterium]